MTEDRAQAGRAPEPAAAGVTSGEPGTAAEAGASPSTLEADVAAETAPGTTAAPATGPAAVDRRAFVRSIAGESVTTAGRLAGMSGMLLGSFMNAARAANDTFATLGGSVAAAAPVAPAPPATILPAPAAPAPVRTSAVRLTDADLATLASLRVGLLATNQPGASPAVGVVRFLFDGTAFRIPGRSATARTGNLQRDPFAALTLIDAETGDALLLAGRTRIVYGAEGREGAAAVLTACDVPLPDGWEAADSRGEPVLVILEPQRLFRRRAADERP